MTTSKIRKYLAGLAIGLLAWLPTLSYAIGLGQLKVHSALDEPLNGEIPFTSLNAAERRKLDIRLASRSDFASAGIDRASSLNSLKFSVAKRVDGRYFLQIKTDEPFREPFLHVLIHLQWAGGRLVREYTALIDPPYLAAGKPSQIETPKIAAIPEPKPIEKAVVPGPAPVEKQVAMAEPEKVMAPETKKNVEPAQTATPSDKGASGKIAEEAAPEPLPFEPGLEPLPDLNAGQAETGKQEKSGSTSDQSGALGPGKDSSKLKMTPSGWPEDEVASDQPIVEELTDTKAKPTQEELVLEPGLALEPDLADQPGQDKTAMEPPSGAGDLIGPSGFTESLTGEYKVNRGDTLWHIAKQARPDTSVSIEQVAMAIFRNNKRAFFDNNVNNLKAGKILSIPDSGQLSATGPKEARKEFLAQYSAWQEYKLRLASANNTLQMDEGSGTSMESMPQEGSAGINANEEVGNVSGEATAPITEQSEAASSVTAKKDSESAAGTAADEKKQSETTADTKKTAKDSADITPKASEGMPAEDLLKIVRSKQGKEKAQQDKAVPDSETSKQDSKSEKSALADKVATLEESLSSADLANEEAGKRAGNVSEQLDTQKRLIELENQNLANTKPSEKASVPEGGAAATTPEKTKRRPRVAPAVPAPPEQSFLDQMLELVSGAAGSILPIVGGIGVLLAGVVGLLIVRRRRHANIEFEESILNSQIDSEGTLSMDSGDESEGGDTSFLSDFSQGGMGNVSTDEVDPVAEAEVYLAYGRDEQAEEILKDAIIKEPTRHELREKILEIYSQRNDVSAFETVAEELYAALEGRGGELWDRVAAMGAKLNPDNPMFGGEGAGLASAGDTVPPGGFTADTTHVGLDDSGAFDSPTEMAHQDTGIPDPSTDPTIRADAMDFSLDGGLDLGSDDSLASQDTGPITEESDEIDFSLTMGNESETSADDGGLDFSMDDTSEAISDSSDTGGLDFSMDDTSEAISDSSDTGGLDFSMDDSAAETDIGAGDNDIQWDVDSAAGDSESSAGDSSLEMMMESDSEIAIAEGESEQEQWDETATKLDLARAYIDMGDAEGARSILDEVLAEGNEDQKKQAADLASQIA